MSFYVLIMSYYILRIFSVNAAGFYLDLFSGGERSPDAVVPDCGGHGVGVRVGVKRVLLQVRVGAARRLLVAEQTEAERNAA
jgi:hypothetical protein